MAGGEVAREFAIARVVHLTGPDYRGGVDGRPIVDPLLEEIVLRTVAHDGQVLARQAFQLRQDAGARQVAGPRVIPGHGPVRRHVEAKRLAAHAEQRHRQAGQRDRSGDGGSHGAAVAAPDAHMAQALEHERVDQAGHRGGVVRVEPGVERHAGRPNAADDHQRADAPVAEQPPAEYQRQGERRSQEEHPKGAGLPEGVAGQPRERLRLEESGEFPSEIEIAHLPVAVWFHGQRLLPEEDARRGVLVAGHLVRHAERIAGHAPVVVAGARPGDGEDERGRQHQA